MVPRGRQNRSLFVSPISALRGKNKQTNNLPPPPHTYTHIQIPAHNFCHPSNSIDFCIRGAKDTHTHTQKKAQKTNEKTHKKQQLKPQNKTQTTPPPQQNETNKNNKKQTNQPTKPQPKQKQRNFCRPTTSILIHCLVSLLTKSVPTIFFLYSPGSHLPHSSWQPAGAEVCR